jgi:hypothetical protein
MGGYVCVVVEVVTTWPNAKWGCSMDPRVLVERAGWWSSPWTRLLCARWRTCRPFRRFDPKSGALSGLQPLERALWRAFARCAGHQAFEFEKLARSDRVSASTWCVFNTTRPDAGSHVPASAAIGRCAAPRTWQSGAFGCSLARFRGGRRLDARMPHERLVSGFRSALQRR